jgi:hypothetical protein
MITTTYQKIVDDFTSWPGVTTSGNQLQGVEFQLGLVQFGHLHSFEVAHLPVSTDIYPVLIGSGAAKPHPVFTNSNWVEVPMSTPDEGERLIALFRLNYNLFRERPAA